MGSLGIDHVSYALFDFSLSFLIYLVITALVHLYQHTGQNGAALAEQQARNGAENGYAKIDQRISGDGPEAYELTEQDNDRDLDLASGSGDDDATKIGREDEVDWIDRRGGQRVRL